MKTLMLSVLALTVLVLTSCQKSVDKPNSITASVKTDAIIYSTNYKTDYEFVAYDSCAGENVMFLGSMHINLQLKQNPTGKFDEVYTINLQGVKGIGLVSGANWTGGGSVNTIIHDFDITRTDFSTQYHIQFEQQGGGKLTYDQSAHLVVNANGLVSVDFSDSNASCK